MKAASEVDHLGNLDYIRGEKIRAPDLNAKRGPIAGNNGFFIKGLDPTSTHGVRILHDSPQIFGTARVLNFTNFSLAFARRGRMTRWRGSINHGARLPDPSSVRLDLDSSAGLPPMRRLEERFCPEEVRMIE